MSVTSTLPPQILPSSMVSNGAGGSSDERSPLLSNDGEGQNGHGEHSAPQANRKIGCTVWVLLTLAFIAALVSNDEEGQNGHGERSARPGNRKIRSMVWGLLTLAFTVALVVLIGFEHKLGDSFKAWLGSLPKDPTRAACKIMDEAPVIVSLCVPQVDYCF